LVKGSGQGGGFVSCSPKYIIKNYLGSFLTPDDNTLMEIQNLVDKFALDGQIMSANRRYLLPEQGGAGLINLRDFLLAQKSWIKRAASNIIDNWRLTLALSAPDGNILNIRSCDIDPNVHLILYELSWAYEFFAGCFSLVDNNFVCNSIYQNMAFVRSERIVNFLMKTSLENYSMRKTSMLFGDSPTRIVLLTVNLNLYKHSPYAQEFVSHRLFG
jgi:hypothetical protein